MTRMRLAGDTRGRSRAIREGMWKDLAYVVLTLIFFVASWLYVKGLERL